MSCSMKRIVTSRGSAAITPNSSALSPAGMPAAGSSSSRIARPRRERQRDLDQPLLAVGQVARAACRRRRRAAACASSSRRLVDLPRAARATGPMPDAARGPSRSQIASTTDSSTVRPGNSVLIWNVRVMPRLTRSCCGSAGDVARRPRNTSPAVGAKHAGQQVDERRLAGAVRADQRVARAGGERERDVAVRLERAELLRQAFGAQRASVMSALRLRAKRSRSAASPPRMPPRANSTTTTSSRPSQNCQ